MNKTKTIIQETPVTQEAQPKETESTFAPEVDGHAIQEEGRSYHEETDSTFEDDSQLSPKQERAILGLLTQRTIDAAAEFARVGPRTLYRWLKDREFNAAYREARRAAHWQTIRRLDQMAGLASDVIGDIMNDPDMPPAIRLRAADKILRHTARAMTLDVEERMKELELGAEEWKRIKDNIEERLPLATRSRGEGGGQQ